MYSRYGNCSGCDVLVAVQVNDYIAVTYSHSFYNRFVLLAGIREQLVRIWPKIDLKKAPMAVGVSSILSIRNVPSVYHCAEHERLLPEANRSLECRMPDGKQSAKRSYTTGCFLAANLDTT